MKIFRMVICMAVGALLAAAPALAQNGSQQGNARAVVTIMPKHAGDTPTRISREDLNVAVGGKQSSVTHWVPLDRAENSLELVLLLDSGSRLTLGSQMGDIEKFILGLPANAKVAVAYMQNGSAVFAGPLSADHQKAVGQLHLPGRGAGSSSSPYFCLSNLATHWPSKDPEARREVLMVTDGVDYYNPRFNPSDPYVEAAINDSVRSGLVVFSIYWLNQGFADRTVYQSIAGQSLLNEVSEATGGNSYYMGTGNPVSFKPYLTDIARRLQNQYKLGVVAHLKGEATIESLKLKIKAPGNVISAPQQVFVGREEM